jgi:DNA-binding transcriptional LysR family regulator
MNWDNVRIFLELMRTGSLSGAANAVGLTHPTLRRHLDEMEHKLGVVLFTRSPDGLKPTPAAFRLEQSAIMMESAAETLRRRASADTVSATGIVKIVCSEIMALEVLPPVFAALRARHQGLQLAVAIDNKPTRVLRGAADISLQMARPAEEDVLAQLACRIEIGLFAHARYISQTGTPASLEDLESLSLIGWDAAPSGADLFSELGLNPGPGAFVFRTESQYAQLAAVRAGAGVGALQAPLASRDPGMVRVLPDLKTFIEKWLVTSEDAIRDRRVQVVYDMIAEYLAAYTWEARAITDRSPDPPDDDAPFAGPPTPGGDPS